MKKILVVDDEFELASSVESILEDEGFKVMSASDGLEAFELILNEAFDLVISDVMMPRCDGYQLLEKIRQEKRVDGMPVILMSAAQLKPTKFKPDNFLKKPFDIDTLIGAVEGLVKKK